MIRALRPLASAHVMYCLIASFSGKRDGKHPNDTTRPLTVSAGDMLVFNFVFAPSLPFRTAFAG